MSREKELRFFTSETRPPNFQGPGDDGRVGNWYGVRYCAKTWHEYRACFAEVKEEVAIGEASPCYLCSEVAPRLIKDYLPDGKLIMVLRNPVDRAFSTYTYLRQYGREPLASFSAALAEEEQRKRDNWEFAWQYRELGLYSQQVQRYLDLFPREQVWVGIYDDFVEQPLSFVRDIFRFLDVDDGFEPHLGQKINASGIPKIPVIHMLLGQENLLRTFARKLISRRYRGGIREFIGNRNLRPKKIPPDVAEELKAFFRLDIEKLEQLIGRDLPSWKK